MLVMTRHKNTCCSSWKEYLSYTQNHNKFGRLETRVQAELQIQPNWGEYKLEKQVNKGNNRKNRR